MTTKKTKADPLVAAATILIDGKAFEAGEKIADVPEEEINRAVDQKRVLPKSVFERLAAGIPAPELGPEQPEGEAATEDGEGDTGEGDTGEGATGDGATGEGDNGGSGQ